MTKRDFVLRIASETNLIQSDVAMVVQKTLDCLSDELAQGRTVELRGFGVFDVKVRRAKIGRNPRKPKKDIHIPAKAVVKFHLGKALKNRLGKLDSKMVK
jgi:nucleoid DNA-binding protein